MDCNSICVDLGGTLTKAALFMGERMVASMSCPSLATEPFSVNLMKIEHLVNELIKNEGVDYSVLSGIGFAFPGLVDPLRHRVMATNGKFCDAHQVDLRRWATSCFGLPLFLENDARLSLLGEWQFGAGRGCDNIVLLTLGTGVGSAVLLEGRLLRGSHFQAGNLAGHFTVNIGGIECKCGNRGCVEAEASTWRLPEMIRLHKGYSRSTLSGESILDYKSVFAHAERGDQLACEITDYSLAVWGAAVVNLIHAFDPEKVIVSGGVVGSKDLIIDSLQGYVDKYAWTPWGRVEVVSATHHRESALWGGHYLVRSQISGVAIESIKKINGSGQEKL